MNVEDVPRHPRTNQIKAKGCLRRSGSARATSVRAIAKAVS
ncbi:MAG: hypothetical protein RR854_09665 [Muribaculaceae bacterium]